jgi:hypothetical protein
MIIDRKDSNMTRLDEILSNMQAEPLPGRLATIDESVLSQLAQRQANTNPLSGRMVGFAIVAAVGMGLASGVAPGAPVEAATTSSPFGVTTALAPSTLLESG